MFFIIREVIGWLFVCGSLYVLRIAFNYIENRQVIEGGVVAFIFSLLLSTGMYFIRVSTATRICMTSLEREKSVESDG